MRLKLLIRTPCCRYSASAVALWICFSALAICVAAEPDWLWSTAHPIPKELTTEGSGYFSIVEGKNGKIYVGTAKYGFNDFLVEFDPHTKAMKTVVDCMSEIGSTATGFAAQAKIHTRNNVGESGRITSAPSKAIPSRTQKRSGPTILAAIRWFMTRRRVRRAFTAFRCPTRA